MFSPSKLAIFVAAVLAVVAVEGFAPVAAPSTRATSTELGVLNFFKQPTEKQPTLSLDNKKKAAPAKKKVVAKKPAAVAAKKKVVSNPVAAFGKPAPKKETKFTIYERECHIN